ncbi:hypothetical protein Taro_014502 [Colocasia esculenta]|uniref:Uncharacterized protein n=1 Tax=Colocasia esculenta TaxID=4460 RepID=A0A843U968_COLES|nr:hypothetical protein [Colocasia esculenta]
MERHKPIPQLFFPSYNRTPKYLGCLNTLHPNPRDEFTTCWGHVEELLVAGELWIDHKKDIFFPRSPAATCTNRPHEVDQRNPHNSLTQPQWLATNGKLCKKQWQDSSRPCKMWFRLEIRLQLLGTEPVIYTAILRV